MIISITGPPGSGKSTVAKILAQRLGYNHYDVGKLRREAARRRGMTLEEYNRLGEADPSTDVEVDQFQEELGRKEDDFIIEGRMAHYFIPHSFKVYLDVTPEEGARRVYEDLKKRAGERNERVFSTVEETLRNLEARERSDQERYRKYYGVDHRDTSRFDLVIDTTHVSPEEVAHRIILEAQKHTNNLNKKIPPGEDEEGEEQHENL